MNFERHIVEAIKAIDIIYIFKFELNEFLTSCTFYSLHEFYETYKNNNSNYYYNC